MKNIIYNGVHTKTSEDLIRNLSHRNIFGSLIYISSNSEDTLSSEVPCETIRVNYYDAIYDRYDTNSYPIDQELLNSISANFFNTIKMMDRNDPSSVYSFEVRLQKYYKQVKYWNHIIEKYKINCFISINYPHEIYDYIIYSLCKAKDIKTIILSQTQVNGYVQIFEDIELNDPRLKNSETNTFADEPLSNICQQHFDIQTGAYKEPFYMELNKALRDKENSYSKKIKFKIKKALSIVKKIVFATLSNSDKFYESVFYNHKFGKDATNELHQYYSKLSITPDLSKKYAYIPLHFQPECTTSPQGNYFVSQELMIDMIRDSLPANIAIYVKEHPFQTIHGRSKELYDAISRLPNVYLIDKKFESMKLIKNSEFVATVTGTAGWEALFQNKSVLLFGDIFFKYAPGVHIVKSRQDCKNSIESILSKRSTFTSADLIIFLKKIDKYFIRGWIDDVYSIHSNISYEDNQKNLTEALEKHLTNF